VLLRVDSGMICIVESMGDRTL